MELTHIYIYPIKSLAGISLQHSELDQFGLKHDRRWMLVDEDGLFVTQRRNATLCRFCVNQEKDGFRITHKDNRDFDVFIPMQADIKGHIKVKVWDDECEAEIVDPKISAAFSEQLQQTVHLVKMPDNGFRQVDTNYANQGTNTAFSDGFPLLIIGQESLNHLNSKLDEQLTMKRFRPNLVFSGGTPHQEDSFKEFKIGESSFKGVKPCSRCVITTINPETAQKGTEPLKTLSTYRIQDGKVMFGMNVLHLAGKQIMVNDELLMGNDSIDR